jgi:hypothetical protein
LIDGHSEGNKFADLVKLLTEKLSARCVGIKCFDTETGRSETSLKFLCKRYLALNVEKRFMYLTKQSWKLTALSLINIIDLMSPPARESCLQVYFQAYKFVYLVDESNQETDKLLSKAADGLLESLCAVPRESTGISTARQAVQAINNLVEESKDKAEVNENREDSVDWKKVAAGN